MTIGHYAIPAQPVRPVRRQARTLPYPFCRDCLRQQGHTPVAPIDERQHPSITCRGCKRRLREWR